MTKGPTSIVARARWNWLYHRGQESARLKARTGGWSLEGSVDARFPEGPAAVRYAIDVDTDWRTRMARIRLAMPKGRRDLWVEVDDEGRWQVGGMEMEGLHGCVDVDLAATPVTNTLPIRRLDLPVGGSADLLTAWMTFPDLEIRPVRQRYTRIADRLYRFEAFFNRFAAEFEVDQAGLVLTYPGFWERMPERTRRKRRPRARA